VNGDLAMRMHLAAKILAAPREFFATAQHQQSQRMRQRQPAFIQQDNAA
jgi:hypothetical protein